MAATPRPSLPETYTVPTVWGVTEGKPSAFGGMNRPTAGARHEAVLPKGEHPIQLYSLGTPNGQKVTILLEELGIDYDAWKINIMALEQFGSEFTAINPNGKIPCMLDFSESKEEPLRIFESGSILLHLADTHGKFIPKDKRGRTECISWLMWQMGSAPFIGGGFGHFYKYAPIAIEYAIDRYTMETKRLLDVLDKHLADKAFIVGDEYTIADMAVFPWVRCIDTGYGAATFVGLSEYKNVAAWSARISERDAVKRGLRVNGFGPDAVANRHSPADFEPVPTPAPSTPAN